MIMSEALYLKTARNKFKIKSNALISKKHDLIQIDSVVI